MGWTDSSGVETALVMHYDGSSWTTSGILTLSNFYSSSLYSVHALASNDVWAVGEYAGNSASRDQTLILHWNGSAWGQVSSPNALNSNNNVLNGVAAVSTTDAWAVGYYINSSTAKKQTLIEHWNGSQWSKTDSPNIGSDNNQLQGVSVVNSNNVWASGSYTDSGVVYTLIMQWDGTSSTWSQVTSANPGLADILFKIAAIASDDIWSVGGYVPSGIQYHSLTEHWNGSAWTQSSSQNVTGTNSLRGLAPVESNAVWATGYGGSHTLAEYWDGSSWSIVDTPANQGTGNNLLYGASVTLGGSVAGGYDAWTVGYYTDSGVKKTLALRYHHPHP